MKKFLALFFALMLVLSCALVACSKDKKTEDEGDDGDDVMIGYQTTTSNTTVDPANTDTPVNLTWVEATGDVYVVAGAMNVRNATNYDKASIVGTVNFGDKLTRVKYNDLWTVITYGGVECYVATKYLTADVGEVTFNDVTPVKVYVNVENTMNLRSQPYFISGDDSNIAFSVKRGTELTQTGVSANGKWVRVTYTYTPEGKTEAVTAVCYCRPANISTTIPGENGAAATTAASNVVG